MFGFSLLSLFLPDPYVPIQLANLVHLSQSLKYANVATTSENGIVNHSSIIPQLVIYLLRFSFQVQCLELIGVASPKPHQCHPSHKISGYNYKHVDFDGELYKCLPDDLDSTNTRVYTTWLSFKVLLLRGSSSQAKW